VKEITVGDDGRATGVLYFDRRGNLQQQLARVVVVCCNGIGTPRLLLASTSKLFPDGLANSTGHVGRYFMNHPSRYVEGIFDEPFETESFTGNPFFSQQFYETDRGRGFVRGYSLMVYRPYGPASVAWGDSEPVPWGRGHHEEMVRRFGHSVGIAVMAEDLPEAANRVDLDPGVKDSNGIPAARVTYRASETIRCSRAARQLARCWRRPAPAGFSIRDGCRLRPLHGDCSHGQRSAGVSRRRLEPGPRRAEPVRRRRQLVHNVRRREPDLHDRCARGSCRGWHLAAASGVDVTRRQLRVPSLESRVPTVLAYRPCDDSSASYSRHSASSASPSSLGDH
jgi:hypothetical protein